MALIYTQGFENIGTSQADPPDGWDGLRGDGFWDRNNYDTLSSTIIDHNDGKALQQGNTASSFTNNLGWTSKAFTAATILTVGFGVKLNAVPSATTHCPLISLFNGTSYKAAIGVSSAVSGEFPRFAAEIATTQYRSTQTMYPGPWYYVESQFKIANPGWVKIRVNNIEVLNQALAVTSSSINIVVLGSGISTSKPYYDDLYILSDSGSAPWNDFLGPIIIHPVYPTDAGSTQSWSSTETPHHGAVDDSGTHDSDTSYISSNTNNAVEYFKITSPSINGTVVGLKLKTCAKQSTYGPNNIALIDKAGASEREGTTQILLSEQYAYYYQHLTNLADSSSLTPANINNAEFGVKIKKV